MMKEAIEKATDIAWGMALGAGFGELVLQNPRISNLLATNFPENNMYLGYLITCTGIGFVAAWTPSIRSIRNQISHYSIEAEIAMRMFISNFNSIHYIPRDES